MEIYRKNILDSNEDDENHMLSFTNTVSIEALTTGEKNINKFSITPIKTKSFKLLKRNTINKEIISDIDSTGHTSEKDITKNLNENNRYIDNKENNNDNDNNLNVQPTETPNIHIRRDIFGSEIKKGGKQHISFADNAILIKSRIKGEEEDGDHKETLENTDFNINDDKKFGKTKGLKNNNNRLKNLKKMNVDNPNKNKYDLVEVIEIQNYKELNKSDYLFIDEDVKKSEDQETVCCTSICIIY